MKKSKTLNEVTLIEKISKNLQIFLKINPMQEEALPSHKLQDHAYKQQNPFTLKKEKPPHRKIARII